MSKLRDKKWKKRVSSNKEQNGITLIALVITVVVLLILAGISIMMLTGDNSILKNASDAKSLTEISQIDEAINLAISGAISSEPLGDITDENIRKTLAENMPTGVDYTIIGDAENGWTITVPSIDKTYTISSTGAVASTGGNKDSIKPAKDNVADVNTEITTSYGTIDVIWLSGTSNTPTSTPNSPESHLKDKKGNEMTKVTWSYDSSTGTWSEDDTVGSTWYNYMPRVTKTDNTSSMWANAKNSDGSYFVWIPRYAYRITYYESQDAWKNGEDPTGYYDGYGMWNASTGAKKYDLDDGIETIDYNGKKYIVHPAFMGTGSEELGGGFGTDSNGIEGFWVAKYEMSREDSSDGTTWTTYGSSNYGGGNNLTTNAGNTSSTKIRTVSKPSVNSWKNIYIGNCYLNGYNYDRDKESHLMKNSEWGAVAYLTHSQYGRNGYEIDINNSSSYITGTGGGATNASPSGTTYAYNTATGAKASTTGNIYGIYDMSGGSWEYVAAWDSASTSTNLSNGSSFNGYTNTDGKVSVSSTSTEYATAYSNGTDTYYGTEKEHEVGKVGDATKEVNTQGGTSTSHWFSDFSNFVYSSYSFFVRGGACYSDSDASVFCSESNGGYTSYYDSFRVVLCP